MERRPDILILLNDDMGFSDLGCYGGEVCTPSLDALAGGGLRFTQFYNTARCCPSRASLLTGLHPHQADVGHMTGRGDGVDGYRGDLSDDCVTIAEVLSRSGYRTAMSGKWHVARLESKHNWPRQRGFDRYYGILGGCCSYFRPSTLHRDNDPVETVEEGFCLTDAITDEAVRQIEDHARQPGRPFLQYVAYTAPHWPLHAPEEDIARYRGRFDAGWDALRRRRLERMVEMGLIDPSWKLTDRDPAVEAWDEADHRQWHLRRMEVYAAQIERMDRGIGRIFDALRRTGRWDNTLILFLSDNGGCAEEIEPQWRSWLVPDFAHDKTLDGRDVRFGNDPGVLPGPADSYQSYGVPWANLSNTPFREYKHWVHEGGIATPLLAHWPARIRRPGTLCHVPAQLPDILATCIDLAEAEYPREHRGRQILPHEGFTLTGLLEGEGTFARETLFWEHEGNRAVRRGRWKLVRKYPGPWELYDMETDRTELTDLAGRQANVAAELAEAYAAWADRCGVRDWDEILQLRGRRGEG